MIAIRKGCSAFAGSEMQVFDSGNGHVFGYVREYGGQRVLVLVNFSELPQTVVRDTIRIHGPGYCFTDLFSGKPVTLDQDIVLGAYQVLWWEVA